MKDLTFCPNCGKQTLNYINNRKWGCSSCNLSLYNNVATAVGLVIIVKDNNNNNKVLLIKRGKNPHKGKLAVPGGFVDPGEGAEEAAIRECKEEIGLVPTSLEYLTSATNNYTYKEIDYTTCDIFFLATIEGYDATNIMDHLKAEDQNEITGFVVCDLNTKDDIEKIDLAFYSAKVALSKLFK
jgi:ADP-ribose pyrophosphatase YjhB (NUDIX family)